MAMTLQQFITQLDESGVFSAEDIATFQKSQTPAAESAEDLGKLLVKHKKVTKLQAQLVYQGKGKQLLLGNYLILNKIGAGGMGDVYLAEHRRMKRQVALKTLPAAMTKDSQSIQRFQREVQAAAKLTHPNIVAAYDADEAKGIHYFVMEYVEGIDLSAVVKKRGVLKVDVAVDYILQAAKGLEFAHNKGVIHRDIKPANMLLDNDGTIKILDMGLARIEDEAHEIPATQLTQDGSVMGTVDYMAPEQAKDTHTADARSDIYSLGCSLYYLLTGESVYRGSTMVNRIMAHQNDPIPSLTGKHILISQDVDAVFQKMVAKRPEDRFQAMSEVIVAIENCIQMKSSPTVSTEPSDPELHKFLQSQRVASSPTVVMSADVMTAEKPLTETQNETLTSGFLNHTLGGTTFKPLQKRMQSLGKRGWIAVGTVLASLILILLAGIVLKVDTAAGTIILEIDQPELAGAVVSVDDQKKITIKTGEGTEPIEVVADEKTHTLQVTKGGFETFTKQFTVKAGGKETIKVRLEPLVVVKKIPPSPKENYALEFDGKASYVSVDTLKYAANDPLTLEAFIIPKDTRNYKWMHSSLGLSRIPLVLNVKLEAGEVNFRVYTVNAQYKKDNHAYFLNTARIPLPSKGIHVAVCYNGKRLSLFLNGKKMKTTLTKRNADNSYSESNDEIILKEFYPGESFRIGCHIEDHGFYKGIIDEVRISNTARYTKDFTPAKRFENDKNTMALYHFDEGSGDILKDSSGNGHDGKIVGAKWVKVDDELQVVKPPKEPLSASSNPERRAAEWVLSIGGQVGLNANTLYNFTKRLEDLPKEPFFVYSIHLKDNGKVTDDGLRLLKDLKQLRHLHLQSTPVTNAGMQHLSKLTNLSVLNLYSTSVGDDGLQYLAKLEKLTSLNLTQTKITDVGLKHLTNLRNLTSLNLNGTKTGDNGLEQIKNLIKITNLTGGKLTTDDGLKHLGQMKHLYDLGFPDSQVTGSGLVHLHDPEELLYLNLTSHPVTDRGLQNISKCKNLKTLKLSHTQIADAGLKHLEAFKRLESLDLQETKVTPQGVANLQKALPNCKVISDFDTPMTDREVAEWVIGMGGSVAIPKKEFSKIEQLPIEPLLIKSVTLSGPKVKDHDLNRLAGLKFLMGLNLASTQIGDAGLQYLKEIKQTNLAYLNLNNTKITDKGLGYVKNMPDMINLNAGHTTITNSGLEHLKDLKNLQILALEATSISDLGLQHLHSLKKLETLDLRKTKVTPQGIASLQKALPKCKIESDFEIKNSNHLM